MVLISSHLTLSLLIRIDTNNIELSSNVNAVFWRTYKCYSAITCCLKWVPETLARVRKKATTENWYRAGNTNCIVHAGPMKGGAWIVKGLREPIKEEPKDTRCKNQHGAVDWKIVLHHLTGSLRGLDAHMSVHKGKLGITWRLIQYIRGSTLVHNGWKGKKINTQYASPKIIIVNLISVIVFLSFCSWKSRSSFQLCCISVTQSWLFSPSGS